MLYVVQMPPDADLAHVRAALARLAAPEVALEWPLGAACALATAGAMMALVEICATLRHDVVIIGGDEALRAHAVAAGFAAATSLAEWETSGHRAVKPAKRTGLLGRQRAAQVEQPETVVPHLVPPQPDPEDDDSSLYAPLSDDPPEYVVDLLVAGQTDDPAGRVAAAPTIPLRSRFRPTWRDEKRREAEAVAARERAQQAYEERITTTIRSSSDGLGTTPTSPDTDEPPSDPGENASPANA